MNRVLKAIEKVQANIDSKNFSPELLEKQSKILDMAPDEYCSFQTLKSAYMGTKLTTEEAQSIYFFLGNTPEHFNKQPFAVKHILTKIYAELLQSRIGQH